MDKMWQLSFSEGNFVTNAHLGSFGSLEVEMHNGNSQTL